MNFQRSVERQFRNSAWSIILLALVSFDPQSRSRCGQVQGKHVKSHAEIISSLNARQESEITNKLFRVPSDMQSQRRFMWTEMDKTVDTLMRGIANGAHAMKKMILPSSKTNYRYLPAASTVTKYLIKRPLQPVKITRPPLQMSYPPPHANWLIHPVVPTLEPIIETDNYKVIEDLALQEWLRNQSSVQSAIYPNDFNPSNVSLDLSGFSTHGSFEDCNPIAVDPSASTGVLYTNVRPFIQDGNDQRPYDVIEHFAEESVKRPESLNTTASENYVDTKSKDARLSDLKTNSTQRRTLTTPRDSDKISSPTDVDFLFSESYISEKSQEANTTTSLTPPKLPKISQRLKFALKFGDKLHYS